MCYSSPSAHDHCTAFLPLTPKFIVSLWEITSLLPLLTPHLTLQADNPIDLDAAEVATAVALVRQLDGSVGHEQVRTSTLLWPTST